MTVMVIGNSHTRAIKESLKGEDDWIAKQAPNVAFDVGWVYNEKIEGSVGDITTTVALERAAALGKADVIVLSIAGTQHNVLGLLQHDIPYDVAPFDTEPGVRRTIIPRTMLRAEFENLVRGRRLIPIFEKTTIAAVYHLATPPPKKDEAYIRARMARYRGTSLAASSLNPPALRMRMWEVEMEALAGVCAEWGIGFIGAPPQARTPEGFLRTEYYGADATHANPAYGRLVLEQLADLAAKSATAAQGERR